MGNNYQPRASPLDPTVWVAWCRLDCGEGNNGLIDAVAAYAASGVTYDSRALQIQI